MTEDAGDLAGWASGCAVRGKTTRKDCSACYGHGRGRKGEETGRGSKCVRGGGQTESKMRPRRRRAGRIHDVQFNRIYTAIRSKEGSDHVGSQQKTRRKDLYRGQYLHHGR